MNPAYTILLFYKFVPLEDLEVFCKQQWALWDELGLKGRMIIAPEGINGTLEGETKNTNKYRKIMHSEERFSDLWFKDSVGTGTAFKKISIKVRGEVCTLGRPDLGPQSNSAQYITHDQLHQWYLTKKEFYIIDMRNDYEHEVGTFDNSIAIQGVRHFKDIPNHIDSMAQFKDKPVVTFCTGGIRCEKGSGLLLENGFSEVYQLEGGIHTYLAHHPGGFFKGKLYVFDGRVVVSFGGNTDEVIGKCRKCSVATENYVNIQGEGKHMHYVMCHSCVVTYKDVVTYVSHT